MNNMVASITGFINECLADRPDINHLLQYLVKIQQRYSSIPETAVHELAKRLHTSAGHIRSVVSFYSFLSLESQGRYRILFSDNITDRFGDNQLLLQRLQSRLGEADATIDTTSCTGLCDQGPGLLVNGLAVGRLDQARIDQIAQLVLSNTALEQWPSELFRIDDNIQRQDIQLQQQADAGEALDKVLAVSPEDFLAQLESSGLRGRGGAGFNTASKWRFCRQAEGENHYVVCNADEGEPGTFKDRVLLHRYADAVFEGMTICARVIGARHGLVYLRGEYLYLVDELNRVLQQRRAQGLLGEQIRGQADFDFDIEIHLGAGAYICGEESALLESLEGKRGNPRIRPPFPVQQGYLRQPTVVNNVETFWSVTHIAAQGAAWFNAMGTTQSSGTRLLSISGDCTKPGIYEYPFGVSLNQILADCGGEDAQAVQMAGAAGHTVLAKDFARQLSFEDLATGGSFMVIGPQRNLLDILHNFATFFQHESCGFCTPCRVGSRLICEFIEQFQRGEGSETLVQQLRDVTALMQRDSFCGLGTSAPTAFIDALEQSPELFAASGGEHEGPVFNLDQALGEFNRIIGQAAKGD